MPNATFGGHVPPASRHPQQFSAQITRQPNVGWAEYASVGAVGGGQHRPRGGSGTSVSGGAPTGEASPTIMTSSNGPWKTMENTSVATSTTSNESKPEHPKAGGLNATACKNCRKEANFMCSACKSVHYCSLDCQVSHLSSNGLLWRHSRFANLIVTTLLEMALVTLFRNKRFMLNLML